ncbi:MAG: hypothetical protein GY939_12865 [Actinomycetia bacterium]|nr:hypothetical protein [Actinomycetes bacterium]
MQLGVVAHVKWFGQGAGDGPTQLEALEITLVGLVVLATLALLLGAGECLDDHQAIARLRPRLGRLESMVPLVVRLSTTAFLFVNALDHALLGPNITAGGGALAFITTWLLLSAGLSLALGFFTRVGIVCLLAGYLLVGLQAPIIDVVDHLEYVGIAAYLWFRGPGTNSLDHILGLNDHAGSGPSRVGLLAYRFAIGMTLATLALSEKILNVATAEAFLAQYNWNVLAVLGLHDRHFIIILGSIELALGLALAFGQAPRLVVLVVLVAMVATTILLGPGEVLGHVFAVGIVFAIWLQEPSRSAQTIRPESRRLSHSHPAPLPTS